MSDNQKLQRKKVIILQRVIPGYRVAVFREITANREFDISLIIGDSLKEFKAKNANDLTGVRNLCLPATAINIFGRVMAQHKGLIKTLKNARPDVIICEAESHFLGYVSAILYKIIHANNIKLIMWCFYALPGIEKERTPLHAFIKKVGREFFDGFISYSSFGKNALLSKGFRRDKITVAVNVCDTGHFLSLDAELHIEKASAKRAIGVDEKFVVSYVGTLDEVKRPDLLLHISKHLDINDFHFFIIGSGPMEDALAYQVKNNNITNVSLTGRLGSDLPLHYRASDVIIIPGRGGIVISEAMCFGVPVIVHQADGVEYDLVIPDKTGILVDSANASDFSMQIKRLSENIELLNHMGINSKNLIKEKHNTESMSHSVIQSIKSVI